MVKKKSKLLDIHANLLKQIVNQKCKELLTCICLGEVYELTPLSCERLVGYYLDLQKENLNLKGKI